VLLRLFDTVETNAQTRMSRCGLAACDEVADSQAEPFIHFPLPIDELEIENAVEFPFSI